MVARNLLSVLLVVAFLGSVGFSTFVNADQHGSVRMYKLNSKNQLNKQRWVKKSHQEGCHSLSRKKKAHRFAQVGFAWCTVYSKKQCKAGSELQARWEGGKYRNADIDADAPQTQLLKGVKMVF